MEKQLEMKNKILASEAATTEISNNLQALVNPLLSADLISRTQVINDKLDVLNGNLADLSSNLNRQQQTMDKTNTRYKKNFVRTWNWQIIGSLIQLSWAIQS